MTLHAMLVYRNRQFSTYMVQTGMYSLRMAVAGGQLSLIVLLTQTVTDTKHQDILRRVFGPDTKFYKPMLNFDNPNLARLVKFGIQNVVWGNTACSHGLARSVLKPIVGAEQEPLLELLGMSLYIICVLLSLYWIYFDCRQRTCACSMARSRSTFRMFHLITC